METKLLSKYIKRFRESSLMDDLKFRKICESKEAIEEILRTILDDKELKVLESIQQKSIDEPIFHGVILDCRCKISTNEIVDIEVQVALDDNPLYRMRYNGSILTVENSPKSKEFKYEEIPKLILIMLCEFDYFRMGKPIYEIDRVVRGTSVTASNGIREIYVNLNADVREKRLKSLFRIMTTVDDVDNDEFPKLSKKKVEVNDLYLGGEDNMSGLTKEIFLDGKAEGKAEGIEQGTIATYVKLYKEKLIKSSDAARMLNISVDEFLKLVK